jgi:hypothetical protein
MKRDGEARRVAGLRQESPTIRNLDLTRAEADAGFSKLGVYRDVSPSLFGKLLVMLASAREGSEVLIRAPKGRPAKFRRECLIVHVLAGEVELDVAIAQVAERRQISPKALRNALAYEKRRLARASEAEREKYWEEVRSFRWMRKKWSLNVWALLPG